MAAAQETLNLVLNCAQSIELVPPGREPTARALYERGTALLNGLLGHPGFESFASEWDRHNDMLKEAARAYKSHSAFYSRGGF
jgi:hypothetical protein